MREQLLTRLEQLGEGELGALVSILDFLKERSAYAVTTSDRAEARVNNALIKSQENLPDDIKFQEISTPVHFGRTPPEIGVPSRGCSFIFGQSSFLGYENDADGTSSIIDKDYANITGQKLNDLEVVNRRTLQSELSKIVIQYGSSFLSIDGGASTAGARFDLWDILVRQKISYLSQPNYAQLSNLDLISKGNLESAVIPLFGSYLPLTGGTIDGDLTVNQAGYILTPNTTNVKAIVVREQLGGLLNTIPTVPHMRVTSAPVSDEDVVRVMDLESGSISTPNTTHPVWISGKIALDFNPLESKARSPYITLPINIENQVMGGFYTKVLKLNGQASHNISDSGFLSQFAESQIDSIPGSNLPTADSRLPFPADYTLFVESNVVASSILSDNSRMRIPISQSDTLRYSAFIDKDGDLSILISTHGEISVPWNGNKVNVIGATSSDARFYLVVNRWSYYPQNREYINTTDCKVELFMPSTFIFYGTPLIKQLNIHVSDVDWSKSVNWTIAIDTIHSTTGVMIAVAVGSKSLIITFTGTSQYITFTLTGTVTNLNGTPTTVVSTPIRVDNKTVSEAPVLDILNESIVVPAWNGYPIGPNIPFNFYPFCTGGIPPYTWSIANVSHVVAEFSPVYGQVIGTLDSNESTHTIELRVTDSIGAVDVKTISVNYLNTNTRLES